MRGLSIVLALFLSCRIAAQARLEFEVASVKENTCADCRGVVGRGLRTNIYTGQFAPQPGKVNIDNITLRQLIGDVYEIPLPRLLWALIGGPDALLDKRCGALSLPPIA